MCCRGCWLQNIFQNFQQQCYGILFVHKYGTTDRRETCVAKYNWWWVYYQNIVTYLKCVLEAPLLYYYIVLIHCSNPLQLVDCVEWGLLLYGLVISTAVGRRGWCRCVWLYTSVRLCDVPGSMLSSHVGHVMYFTAQISKEMGMRWMLTDNSLRPGKIEWETEEAAAL